MQSLMHEIVNLVMENHKGDKAKEQNSLDKHEKSSVLNGPSCNYSDDYYGDRQCQA